MDPDKASPRQSAPGRRPGLERVKTATEEDVRTFCRDKIAHFKIPRFVKFVDAFPMTVTGKVQKFIMREKMIDELGLEEPGSV